MHLLIRALLASLLVGCGFHPDAPLARVHRGPAYGARVDPLAAAPVACTASACNPELLTAIASATRMALEFRGHNIVDTELINAEARRRTATAENGTVTGEKLTTGIPFLELPAAAQLELLASIGVQGALYTSLDVSPPHGADLAMTVRVTLEVKRLSDNDLVWRSRCSAETGNQRTLQQAIHAAAECALESEALW